jgi:DNA-binding IclR family transcriptional regulator
MEVVMAMSNDGIAIKDSADTVSGGSQTLLRGLDVIEAVSTRIMNLTELTDHLGLTKSTTHRLASALVERGYLAFTPRQGYRLGHTLLQLSFLAQDQTDLIQVARPHLEDLAAATDDTTHLGVLDGDQVLYLDKLSGRRRINISSRIGDRQPLTSTGLGKALMLDDDRIYWAQRFAAEHSDASKVASDKWIERIADYVAHDRAFDLEENEDQIRCVAAPIRDASGRIVAAISVSSAKQYMDDKRMTTLSDTVRDAARAISHDLGWTPGTVAKKQQLFRPAISPK